ncbi:hypothetical protein [Chryseobacterium gossypii]|uniref:hypothetical protein n=1 Tax=Chryseobacterium gossypii TaxID=3231602 RepID=UPI003523853C
MSSVVSDTSGVVATGIIEGLMSGREDLEVLIDELYHGKLKVSKAELLRAITGRMTDHYRFMLRQIKHHMAYGISDCSTTARSGTAS